MEQRIGRIDRVRSQSDRRLSDLEAIPDGAALLQVYYPHLEDTVEVLQVQRVLERMNTFLRLMHEGLAVPNGDHRRVDVSREIVSGRRPVEAIRGRLRSAFPIPEWALSVGQRALAVDAERTSAVLERFEKLSAAHYETLRSSGSRPRETAGCLEPCSSLAADPAICSPPQVGGRAARCPMCESGRLGRAGGGHVCGHRKHIDAPSEDRRDYWRDEGSYDLTVEDDVLLVDPRHDIARVAMLLKRAAEEADTLEQLHLPSLDQPLDVFEVDLKQEGATRA